MSPASAAPQTCRPAPLLGRGQVRHARLRPAPNAFAYPTWFLLLPMRTLRDTPCAALPRNRRALVSFHDADHGEGGPDALAWVEGLLAREGVTDADGEIWLHCFPRVLGYAFKPVSFWYAHRRDGGLAAVVAEVHNTFGERHCYLLAGEGLGWGRELRASKSFHVSPFCRIEGQYRFRFLRNDLPGQTPDAPAAVGVVRPPRTVVRIDHDDEDGPLLRTSVSGQLEPLTAGALRRAFAAMPLLTLGVIARIHWQALRLWRKRVPFFAKPAPPVPFVSR